MPIRNNNKREGKSPSNTLFSNWKAVLLKVKDNNDAHNLTIVSAGVAFYVFLAIFPAIIAFVSIYGLAMDPQEIEEQISQLSAMMPKEAFELLQRQIADFVSTSGKALSWGVALSILFSIWSANSGTKSLFIGLDIAYNTGKKRSFVKQNGLSLLFTFGAMVFGILSIAFIVVYPALIDTLNIPKILQIIISWVRWLLLAAILTAFLCLIYQIAPFRPRPKLKWVLIGAVLATIFWLIASWGFTFYVSNFGSYGEVYGSISSVIIFLLWLFISCYIVLLGAEINAAIENYSV